MIQVEFTEQMIEELKYERYHHPHPRVQQKMEVLYLKSQGLAHQDIRRLCDISKTTLTTYLRQYLEGGMERLKQLDYQGQSSQLNAHAASVETYFRDHPPQTIAEAQAKIAEMTGIHRSPNQVNAFLQRIGMKRRKVGFVPGKSGNPDKIAEQETFRVETLEPLLESAKAGKQAVFLWMLPILFIPLF